MVDAVVSVFLEKLLKVLSEEGRVLSGFSDQFVKIQGELLLMQSFLKDAERLKRKHDTLRRILTNLRVLIFEAENILMDCEAESVNGINEGSTNFPVCFRLPNLCSRYDAGKRLREINDKITGIKQNISAYLGVPLFNQASPTGADNHLMSRWSSPVYDHSQIVGLESDTVKIKDWLLQAEEGLLAIGIVGMGGLGKTTIAQMVFNDRVTIGHFDRRIWVSVSQTFTEEEIMRSILRSLGDASIGDNRGEQLRKINQYLMGKRYLIVMDDVWTTDNTWWLRIRAGLPKGNGSCVVVTTRIVKVARVMGVSETTTHWPNYLTDYNSWLLFCKIAFADTLGECTHPELESIGKEIVEKCKGLPLAIKAVGGMMLCKPAHYHEWRRIADHFRDEMAENDDSVKASLQLSYDELPPYLKSCFLCFSLYPEDCVIEKAQLIHWWIGEGFIPMRNGRPSTEAGEYCFSELTNRCLVEVVDTEYSGTIRTCKIHDMVRDLVLEIATEEAFFSTNGSSSCHLGIRNKIEPKQLVEHQKIRALLTTTKSGEVNEIGSNMVNKICHCSRLHVLDLSKSIFESHISGLLDEIGSLQNLFSLSLSNTHPLVQFPSSMKKLHKLHVLDVSYCQNLKLIPSCITSFKSLSVLDASFCGSVKYFPKGLDRLVNLQVLLGFKPATPSQKDSCRLGELKKLTHLRKLGLCFSHSNQISDNEVDTLTNLLELQFLSINCFDGHDEGLASKIDELVPPRQLQELWLEFYPGKVSPGWLSPGSLPMLRFLCLFSGNLEKMNASFWGGENVVWKIEGLKLKALSDLSMEWPVVRRAMPSLRTLSASWCPELESFPIENVGFKGDVWKK